MEKDGVDTEWMREEARREIEEGVHQLETLLESNVDKNFDKLEIYVLRNVLHVEEGLVDWVRLGHYEVCPDARVEGRLRFGWDRLRANAGHRIL